MRLALSEPPRTAVRWVVLGGLVLASSLLTGGGVPLYDGVGFPDQPYRFLDPPPGSPTTPPPSAAHGRLEIVDGANRQDRVFGTDEMGPQILLDIPAGELRVASRHASVSVDLLPVRLTEPPSGTRPDSDLYDVLLSNSAGPVPIAVAHRVSVTLRAVRAGPPGPVMMYRPAAGGAWRSLTTRRIGRDNFGAAMPGAGQYVLVQPRSAGKSASSSAGRLLALAVAAVVAVLLFVLALVRLTASREAQ